MKKKKEMESNTAAPGAAPQDKEPRLSKPRYDGCTITARSDVILLEILIQNAFDWTVTPGQLQNH